MPKERKPKGAQRHEPLATQITKAQEKELYAQSRTKPREKTQKHSRKQEDEVIFLIFQYLYYISLF